MMMNVKCLDTGTTHSADHLNEKAHTFTNTPPVSPSSNNPFKRNGPTTAQAAGGTNDSDSGNDSGGSDGSDGSDGSSSSSDEDQGRREPRSRDGSGVGGGGKPAVSFTGNPFQRNGPPASKSSAPETDSGSGSDSEEEVGFWYSRILCHSLSHTYTHLYCRSRTRRTIHHLAGVELCSVGFRRPVPHVSPPPPAAGTAAAVVVILEIRSRRTVPTRCFRPTTNMTSQSLNRLRAPVTKRQKTGRRRRRRQ